jgi:MFS family permease
VITSTLTQRVGRHEQGVALGISASLNSLSMTLAPPLGGLLLTEGWLHAWTLVPATAAALGLITAVVSRSGTPAVSSGPAASSGPKPQISS